MMRGASAGSLAALTEKLGETVDGGADAARLGRDLFAVAAVLRREPALRRIVTDVSVAGDAKAGLVRELIADSVAPESLDLVTEAVRRRWTTTRDLADSLERLGVVALVRSDDAGVLADELFAFGRLVSENPSLRDALSDGSRSVADRQALLRTLIGDKTRPATLRLAEQALSGSYRTVGVALAEFQNIAAEVHGQRVATVHVAKPLSDDELGRLTEALGRQYQRQVHVNVVVDPEVLGGVKVEIGDDVIDGTVASRLDDARRRLAG